MKEIIIEKLKELGITGEENKARMLLDYMDLILEANEKVNLTAITDRTEFVNKHIIDSLAAAPLGEFAEGGRVIDVGTGGGFPGIPLAICYPDKEYVLVDSLAKRIRIIEDACEKLGIQCVKALHGRAEELARQEDLRDSFDICLSRAVANMSTLTELCMPFVKVGGSFVAYKGEDCDKEVSEAAKAIAVLGGELAGIYPQPAAQGMEHHSLVVVKKISPTEDRFPRKAGKPAKSPL